MQIRWLLVISLIILGLLLYYSDFNKVLEIIANVNLKYFLVGVSIVIFGFLIRISRWKILLRNVDINLSFWKLSKVYLAGQFLSNLTPAKIGDPIRCLLLKSENSKRIGTSVPSVIIERIFDVIVTISIALFGLVFLSLQNIYLWLLLAISIYIIALSIGIYILSSEKRTKKLFRGFLIIFSRFKFFKKIARYAENFSRDLHKSLMSYKDKKTLFISLILSFALWVLEGLLLFISFVSIGLFVQPLAAIIVCSITVLIVVITFLPGGIGSSEAITILLFTGLTSFIPAQIMAAALLNRFFGYWIYMIFGALSFSGIKLKSIKLNLKL